MVQQRDPLGRLLFSLLLQPVLKELGEVEGLHMNAWYLDDGTLVGLKAALQQAWDLLTAQGPTHGLFLSLDKSLVSCRGEAPAEGPLERRVLLSLIHI